MLGWHQATFNLSLRRPLGEVFQALVTCFFETSMSDVIGLSYEG